MRQLHTRRLTWTAVPPVAALLATPHASAPAPHLQEASSLSQPIDAATAMPRADFALHAAGRELSASCRVPKQQHMPSTIVQAHKVYLKLMQFIWPTGKIAQCKRLDTQPQRRMLVRHAAL